MRVHVIQVGRVFVSEGFFTATRVRDAFRNAFRDRGGMFPVYSFLIEHPDGHIVVDTGWHHEVMQLSAVRRICRLLKVDTFVTPDETVGPRMRAIGLRPEDVRLVIPTHLDGDHAGGIGHFPDSQILVHRAEWEYATENRYGKIRSMQRFWPEWFRPVLYDLEPEPYGAFTHSHAVTDRRDVRIVPTPGHSPAHVSPVFEDDVKKLFFAGDHLVRQDWITAEGVRLSAMLHVYKKLAWDTNRKLYDFVREYPSLVLPSHDATAAANLERGEPLLV
jgi:glyoxylase-like metal-dependent hydrolase (beta-lactamase superfamily II)